jgi:hypothetical protein
MAFTLLRSVRLYITYVFTAWYACIRPSLQSRVYSKYLISCLVRTIFTDFFVILRWRRDSSANAMMRHGVDYDVSIPGREFSVKPASSAMGAENSFPAPSSKFVPVHAEKTCRRRCIALLILMLVTSWRSVVNLTRRPLNPRGKKLRCNMIRFVCEPQSCSEPFGRE